MKKTYTLKTKMNIGFDLLTETARRFSSISDNVISNQMPYDVSRYDGKTHDEKPLMAYDRHLSIELVIDKTILGGLDAIVKYNQHYAVQQEQKKYDEETLEELDGYNIVLADKKRPITTYPLKMNRDTINALIAQVQPMLDATQTPLDQLDHAISIIFLGDVLDHNMLNLTSEQWEFVN